jgi:putative ABC transport system permease protein
VKQYWALLYMSLAGLPARLGLVLTIVIGVGCAVGVLVSMLAMGVGARRQAMGNVRADHAVILSVGSLQPFQSSIPKDVAPMVSTLPGIRRNEAGKPIAVPEALVFIQARDRVSGAKIGFPLIAEGPGLTDYTPALHITAGRMFRPGLRELITNSLCVRKYADFAVGDKRTMRGGDWPIVGNFEIGQETGNCLVFGDADVIMSAFGRNTYNQVNVRLQSVEAFTQLENAIQANPSMHLEVKHEAEVVEADSKQINGILNFISYFVGSIMAVAATLGAANSLYAVVDGRRRELATLRALGFGAAAIIASMLTESILLAVPGALLGAGLAWLLFNGFAASPFGFSFHLAVTAPVVAIGVSWALVMGVVGGLLPSLRAARIPVTAALRAV